MKKISMLVIIIIISFTFILNAQESGMKKVAEYPTAFQPGEKSFKVA